RRTTRPARISRYSTAPMAVRLRYRCWHGAETMTHRLGPVAQVVFATGMLKSMPRPSPVRDALRTCLTEHPRHGWSLDELLAALHGESVSADFSTVFRALNWLEAEGEVRRVDLGDGKARYEANTAHPEHTRCNSSGTASD